MLQKKFYIEEFVPSNEHAAEVIGYKGFKVKKISRETHTYIKCPSPNEPPIFRIFGDDKRSLDAVKEKIRQSVAHFDELRQRKRRIELRPGEKLQTAYFKKSDVPCIIGRKGRQIKKIMAVTNVIVISPDTNKDPIFIVSGKEKNVDICVLIMKIIAFCVSGLNYFTRQEVILIYDFLNNNSVDLNLPYCIHSIINVQIFEDKFSNLNQIGILQKSPERMTFYKCWNCKKVSIKIARTLCHHIICCDSCIAHIYADIYLKCKTCCRKVENFIIEFYHEFHTKYG